MVHFVGLHAVGRSIATKLGVGACQVVLQGKLTGVFLSNIGPQIAPSRIEAFEKKIGCELPQEYREFMLAYNGGTPQQVTDESDDDCKYGRTIFYDLDQVEATQTIFDDDEPIPKLSICIGKGGPEADIYIGVKGWLAKKGVFHAPQDDEFHDESIDEIVASLDTKKGFKEYATPLADSFTKFLDMIPRVTPENFIVEDDLELEFYKKAYNKLFDQMSITKDEYGRVHINEEHVLTGLCTFELSRSLGGAPLSLKKLKDSIAFHTFLGPLYLTRKDAQGMVREGYATEANDQFTITPKGTEYATKLMYL